MMLNRIIIFLLLFSVVFIWSCSTISENVLSYSINIIKYEEPNCNNEKQACLLVNISYPVFIRNDSLAHRINHYISNGILDAIGSDSYRMGDVESSSPPSIEDGVDQLQLSFDRLKSDFNDYRTGWIVSVNTIPVYSNDTLEVFAIEYMTYFGGAHPNTNRRYYNINTRTGKILKYNDLKISSIFLKDRAEQIFRLQNDIPDRDDINVKGHQFPGNEFRLPANFGITGDSIILFYNRYEIAPYVKGPTELMIPLN